MNFKGNGFNFYYVLVAIAAIVILALLVFASLFTRLPYTNTYQGVFLTNGQVYFGKITSQSGSSLALEDVYYLKLKTTGAANLESLTSDQFEVVKLGNEIHGPTGKMWVNTQQVLFTVDLKDNSAVVTKITNNK